MGRWGVIVLFCLYEELDLDVIDYENGKKLWTRGYRREEKWLAVVYIGGAPHFHSHSSLDAWGSIHQATLVG